MAKFYGHELILGQVNLLFAVVIVASVRALIDRRTVASGLLIALAVVIKPYAVLFVPWLVAQREWRALAAAAVSLGIAVALPVPIYRGVPQHAAALHLAWWQTVTGSTAPNLLNADNVSLAAMFAKWLGAGLRRACGYGRRYRSPAPGCVRRGAPPRRGGPRGSGSRAAAER